MIYQYESKMQLCEAHQGGSRDSYVRPTKGGIELQLCEAHQGGSRDSYVRPIKGESRDAVM